MHKKEYIPFICSRLVNNHGLISQLWLRPFGTKLSILKIQNISRVLRRWNIPYPIMGSMGIIVKCVKSQSWVANACLDTLFVVIILAMFINAARHNNNIHTLYPTCTFTKHSIIKCHVDRVSNPKTHSPNRCVIESETTECSGGSRQTLSPTAINTSIFFTQLCIHHQCFPLF